MSASADCVKVPPGESSIAEALRLKTQEGLGLRRIAARMGETKDRVRHLLIKAERQTPKLPEIVTDGSALSLYDAACHALAEAACIDEIKTVRDVSEAIRAYARQAKNREMEANAVVLRERAERRLGEKLIEAKAAGQISRGQPPRAEKNCAAPEQFSRVTLEEAGIDRKLSARAQKKAGIADKAFDAMVARMRDDIVTGRRSQDILKAGPINGARSVMGSRFEPNDSLDFFPTPPFGTRALMERVLPQLGIAASEIGRVWDPACGEGHISGVLQEYGGPVIASDIFDYCDGDPARQPGGWRQELDFLDKTKSVPAVDWIITNPPFGDKAIPFVLRALDLARVGVAMFFRSQWAVEGIERYEAIFGPHPPTLCAWFTERVNLCKGRWDPDGTTATAYCWLVWRRDEVQRDSGTRVYWIPPGCREALTKPTDRARFAAWSLPPHDSETGKVIEFSASTVEAAA